MLSWNTQDVFCKCSNNAGSRRIFRVLFKPVDKMFVPSQVHAAIEAKGQRTVHIVILKNVQLTKVFKQLNHNNVRSLEIKPITFVQTQLRVMNSGVSFKLFTFFTLHLTVSEF